MRFRCVWSKTIKTPLAYLIEHVALDCEVVLSNLEAFLEVTLGGHSTGSLTIKRCKTGSESELDNHS